MSQSRCLYLVTYRPLAITLHGRKAIIRYGISPFVDGSIRREPDLESDPPTISALCRGRNFAPRLQVGDRVVYFTVKHRWSPDLPAHRRLTAVLRISKKFDTHLDAANWFRDEGLPLPSNCLVPENQPKPLSQSSGLKPLPPCGKRRQGYRDWDRRYLVRTRKHGSFLVCEPLFIDISWSAPVVMDDDFRRALGRIPPTRNPCSHPESDVDKLLLSLGVSVILDWRRRASLRRLGNPG